MKKQIRVLPVIGYKDEAKEAWEELQRLGVVEDRENPEIILGLTGDGGILGAQRDYYKMQVPFAGFGFGTLNFLHSNNFSSAEDIFNILQAGEWEECVVTGLKARIETVDGVEDCIAFNDVFMKGLGLRGYAKLMVFTKEFPLGLSVKGDGLIVATPQGSTAYSRNCGGRIIPLDSRDLNLTGIGAGERINSIIRRQEILVENVGSDLGLVCDNKEFYGIKRVTISSSKYPVKLLFAPGEDFEQRRYNL